MTKKKHGNVGNQNRRLPEDQKKNDQIAIRVNRKVKLKAMRDADRLGISMSEYISQLILGK